MRKCFVPKVFSYVFRRARCEWLRCNFPMRRGLIICWMWKKVIHIPRNKLSSSECAKNFTANYARKGVLNEEKKFITSFLPTTSSNYNNSEIIKSVMVSDHKAVATSISRNYQLKDGGNAVDEVVEPNSSRRYDIYKYESQVKEAKTIGVGIDDFNFDSERNVLIKYLKGQSGTKRSLLGLNVALFNQHRTSIIESLIELNKFVKTQCWRKNRNVQAYRATFESLFPSGKKFGTCLPVKLLFGDKTLVLNGLNPLVLKMPSAANESGRNDRNSPIIIGTFPVQLQQKQMIQVLLRSLVIHLCNCSVNTLFQYGPIEIITFLCPNNYASLISSTDREFTFVSNARRYQSWFFNQLFEVKRLKPLRGIPCSSFSPPIPLQKNMSYEKKLSLLNIRNGYLYPVSIKPKTEVKIGRCTLVSNLDEAYDVDSSYLVKPSEFLPQYSFWIQLIGRLNSRTRLLNHLVQWFPNLASELKVNVSSYGDVIDFDFAYLDDVFCIIRNELCKHPVLSKELHLHSAMYKMATETIGNFAD
uniref:RNA-directed DNA polymerase n=1 Tax=Syphacia muris TaxID=451379 RepID=A0A158R468_9BILA